MAFSTIVGTPPSGAYWAVGVARADADVSTAPVGMQTFSAAWYSDGSLWQDGVQVGTAQNAFGTVQDAAYVGDPSQDGYPFRVIVDHASRGVWILAYSGANFEWFWVNQAEYPTSAPLFTLAAPATGEEAIDIWTPVASVNTNTSNGSPVSLVFRIRPQTPPLGASTRLPVFGPATVEEFLYDQANQSAAVVDALAAAPPEALSEATQLSAAQVDALAALPPESVTDTVQKSATVTDFLAQLGVAAETLSTSAQASPAVQIVKALSDGMNLLSLSPTTYWHGLTELVRLRERYATARAVLGAAAESLQLSELGSDGHHVSVLVEQLRQQATSSEVAQATVQLLSQVAVTDAAAIAFLAQIADQIQLADAADFDPRVILALSERLILADVADTHLTALGILAVALAVYDATEGFAHLRGSDQIAHSDTLGVVARMIGEATELVSVVDQVADTARIEVIGAEQLGLAAAELSAAQLVALLREEVFFRARLDIGGETYHAVALNTKTMGATVFSDYGFTHFGEHSGEYYGARQDGVYRLDGDTDGGAPIAAVLKTALMDFDNTQRKRMRAMYLGCTTDGELVLKTIVTDGGEKTEAWYKLQAQHTSAETAKIDIGRGLRARYWQFELVNVNGADFELDDITLIPAVFLRREG